MKELFKQIKTMSDYLTSDLSFVKQGKYLQLLWEHVWKPLHSTQHIVGAQSVFPQNVNLLWAIHYS